MSADAWLTENDAVDQIAISRALEILARAPLGVRVLGADGFIALNRPTLDFIADFSRTPISASESVVIAIETLGNWPRELLVELVVADE